MILYQKSIIRFFIKYKTEDDLKTFENLPCIKIIIIHASSSMQLSQIKFFHFFSFFFFKKRWKCSRYSKLLNHPYHIPSKYNAETPSALNFFHFHTAPINISFFYKYRTLPFNAK